MIGKRILSPKDVLGYDPGSRWTQYRKVVEYMRELAHASPRVRCTSVGRTWEGRELLVVIITDPKNMKNLENIRQIATGLSDPRTMPDPQSAASQGKAVVMVVCGVHGYESSNVEMSMTLAYDLATSDEPETKEILENVVLLLCPCINPDGHEKFVKWYSNVDSNYSPEKYYEYRDARGNYYGFDLNRQFVLASQPESNAILRTIREWRPQVIADLHGAGWNMDVRFYFAPYGPISTAYEDIDDRTLQLNETLTKDIAKAFDSKGFSYRKETKTSLSNPSSLSVYSYFRGATGILFECADPGTGISRPVQVPPLYGKRWTLHDMINYHYTATRALLLSTARNRESVLRNFHAVRERAVDKGVRSPPYAYVIPPGQDNFNDVSDLMKALLAHDVEINISQDQVKVDGNLYPKGTCVVLMAQPERTIAKALLEKEPNIVDRTKEPDVRGEKWVSDVGKRGTSWSLPMAMGVRVEEITHPFNVRMKRIHDVEQIDSASTCEKAKSAYAIRYTSNECVGAITTLLRKRLSVLWAKKDFKMNEKSFARGTIIIPVLRNKEMVHKQIGLLTRKFHLETHPLEKGVRTETYRLHLPRIAVYAGKGCHNFNTADVGLVRFALTQYGFDFEEVDERSVKSGKLGRFDVLIIPNGYTDEIMMGYMYNSPYKEKSTEGLGEKGAKMLERFVRKGGFIIGLGLSGELVTKDYLGIVDTDFIGEGYSSGMVVKLLLDTDHPISFGYDNEMVAFYAHHPVYDNNGGGHAVAKYPKSNVVVCGVPYSVHLLFHHTHSGYLADPSVMEGKVAIMDARAGKGHAILIGLDPLFRNYWRSTYRLFFNSILYAASV